MKRICDITAESLNEMLDLSAKSGVDTGVCPVESAYLIAKETLKDACGKGVMCRDGMRQIYLITGDIVNGRGQEEDIALLKEILGVIVECADCDLSYTAAKEILRLVTEFEAEFEQHIKRKACSNLVCPGCHTVHINAAKCKGHGACIAVCPDGAIKGGEGLFSVIVQSKCSACNRCISQCPEGAITGAGFVKPQGPTEPAAVGSWGNSGAAARNRRRRR